MNAGGKAIRSEIHRLINSIWNMESIIVPIYEKGDITVIIETYHSLTATYKFLSSIL